MPNTGLITIYNHIHCQCFKNHSVKIDYRNDNLTFTPVIFTIFQGLASSGKAQDYQQEQTLYFIIIKASRIVNSVFSHS